MKWFIHLLLGVFSFSVIAMDPLPSSHRANPSTRPHNPYVPAPPINNAQETVFGTQLKIKLLVACNRIFENEHWNKLWKISGLKPNVLFEQDDHSYKKRSIPETNEELAAINEVLKEYNLKWIRLKDSPFFEKYAFTLVDLSDVRQSVSFVVKLPPTSGITRPHNPYVPAPLINDTAFGEQLKSDLQRVCKRIFENPYWDLLWKEKTLDLNNVSIKGLFCFDEGHSLQPESNEEFEAINKVLGQHHIRWVRKRTIANPYKYEFGLEPHDQGTTGHVGLPPRQTNESDSSSGGSSQDDATGNYNKQLLMSAGVMSAILVTTGAIVMGKTLYGIMSMQALNKQHYVLKKLLKQAQAQDAALADAYQKALPQLPLITKKTDEHIQKLINARDYEKLYSVLKNEYEQIETLQKRNVVIRVLAGFKSLFRS